MMAQVFSAVDLLMVFPIVALIMVFIGYVGKLISSRGG